MTCNYSNLCGPNSKITSTNDYYVNNGGTAKSGESPENNNNVYMPYVEFKIGEDLFVSGDSSATAVDDFDSCYNSNPEKAQPELNVATSKSYIQSFEMTVGGRCQGTIVIITCDYSVVERLLDITPKSTCGWSEYQLGNEGNADLIGHINIGWIIKDCNGNTKKFTMIEVNNNESNMYETEDGTEVTSGPYIYGIFRKADVTYENTIYKVTLSFVDGGSFAEENKMDLLCFSEEHAGTFTEALLKAVKFNCDNRESDLTQTVSRVSFIPGSDAISKWSFGQNDGGKNGPKSVYNGLRTTLFSFLREISNYVLTDNKKGWWFGYDNGSCGKPSVLLVEDRNPSLCISDKGINSNGQLVTYVVNGGNCSPVIKFTPSFNSVPVKKEKEDNGTIKEVGTKFSIGGGGPSAVDQTPVQLFNCVGEIDENTGNTALKAGSVRDNKSANGYWATISSIAEQLIWRAPVDIVKQTAKAIFSQTVTEAGDGPAMSLFAPIKASLEIHGDPYWANTINIYKNCFIKVILINPFCLEKSSSGPCEYLQKAQCNSKFSGVYKVGEAKHSISSGSYVTTLELYSIGIDDNTTLS